MLLKALESQIGDKSSRQTLATQTDTCGILVPKGSVGANNSRVNKFIVSIIAG